MAESGKGGRKSALFLCGALRIDYSPDMRPEKEAEQAGFDLSLIEENLLCSHEQRALNHQQALMLADQLEKAGKLVWRDEDSLSVNILRALAS